MAETLQQTVARFAGYTAGKDVVEMQRQAPHILASLIEGTSPAALSRSPAAGKWSVTQIIAHMAEDEISSSWRYRQMIEHDNPLLLGFDQDLWQKLGDYAAWPVADAMAMFRTLREANLRMFAQLTPEQWQRTGVHAERGPMTVKSLCQHTAAHDMNHIEQIKRILGK